MVFLRSPIVAAAAFFVLAAVAGTGCGPKAEKRACMGGSDQSSLVTDAAMVRVDVYGPSGHCADGMLVAGSGSPILSRTYGQGQAINLDVPPGPHAIVLSTFADSDGVQLLGVGCTEANLSAGAQICFDLTLVPGPDGGDDLSGALCSTTPDSCPTGQYCDGVECVPGCKLDSDCPKTDAGLGICDKTTHTCEDCVNDIDCGTAAGAACCNRHCTNTKSDTRNCGACGMACTGANTQCCNSVCSNPTNDSNNCGGCGNVCSTLNASMASCGGSMCAWTCQSGFAHCMAGNTGCDTNLGGTGKKLCGTTCVASTSCCTSAECMMPPTPTACYNTAGTCSGVGGSCTYTLKTGSKVCGTTCCNAVNGTCSATCTLACNSGYADCDGDPSNGCETNLASAGKYLCGTQCIPNGTCCPGVGCTMPPSPAACYQMTGTCPAPGGTCTYTENSGSQICGSTCCNAINGTCNGTCGLTCSSGHLDCNNNPTDGCETACSLAHATGGCVGGACAISSCNSGFFDCNATASDGCECGTSCCTNPNTGGPGCTTGGHSDGYTHSFSDCLPVGTPGNAATYSNALANDAAIADTTQAGTYSNGWVCPRGGTNTWTSVCKCVDTSGLSGSCTSWVYTATPGATCKDLNNVNRPCTDWIGHTYKSTGNGKDSGCLCPDANDQTYY
jgi:hypothetical protein